MKKGHATVGVQRQYTGTAGRIENAQVGVYLVYAGPRGHAFIDRALYLPKSWTGDADRMAEAGVPADIEFATKPALARTMITWALDAGVPARWVAGDEVYGADPQLREDLQKRGVGYVLASPATTASPHQQGQRRRPSSPAGCPAGPGTSAVAAPARKANAPTCGPGSNSPWPTLRAATGC